MANVSLETMTGLMELRNKLDAVTQASWSVAYFNKAHPIEKISQEEAEQLIVAYKKILEPLVAILATS